MQLYLDDILRGFSCFMADLTHWGRVTHICVGTNTNIGSDNDLSPGRRHAIIWTNAGILLIGPLATNFSEILIEILKFSFKKIRLNVSSAKGRSSCLGLTVLRLGAMRDLVAYLIMPWSNGQMIVKITLCYFVISYDPDDDTCRYGDYQFGILYIDETGIWSVNRTVT